MRRSGPGAEHQRNRATPRNSPHDLCRHVDGRYVQVIAPQLTVPLAFDDLRALPNQRRRLSGTQLIQEETLHSFDLAQGSPHPGSPGALGRAGTPLAHLHAPGHLRRLVARRVRRRTRRFVRRVLGRKGIAAGATLDPVRRLCALAAALAIISGHRCAARILARAARDPLPVMRLGKVASGDRQSMIFKRRGGGCVAGEPVGGRQTLQRSGRWHSVHGACRGLEDAVASLSGPGRPASGHQRRQSQSSGTEALIGPLVNTVILRTRLGGDPSAREVMRRVRATTLAAFAHQDLPFEELAETLDASARLRPSSLAHVMILFQNAACGLDRNSRTHAQFARKPIRTCICR